MPVTKKIVTITNQSNGDEGQAWKAWKRTAVNKGWIRNTEPINANKNISVFKKNTQVIANLWWFTENHAIARQLH